jgi:tetratricopeptide (TPR) repeat protein
VESSGSRRELSDRAAQLVWAGRAEEALALVAATWRRWADAGDPAGGRAMLAPVLDASSDAVSRERALALYADGLFLFRLGEQAASRVRNEEALAVARAAGDAEIEAFALVGLSRVALRDGRYDDVVEIAAKARAVAAAAGPAATSGPLHMQAAGTRLMPDYDRAADLYRESLELARSLGDEDMAAVELHNLGHVELHRGRVDEAERLFAEHRAAVAASEDPYDEAMTELNAAALAAARGDVAAARQSFDAARRLLEAHGVVLDPDDAFEYDALGAALA